MWLLAMDTAGKVCTTALLKDETVVAEETVHRLLGQAEGLLPQIEQLLQNCQVGLGVANCWVLVPWRLWLTTCPSKGSSSRH